MNLSFLSNSYLPDFLLLSSIEFPVHWREQLVVVASWHIFPMNVIQRELLSFYCRVFTKCSTINCFIKYQKFFLYQRKSNSDCPKLVTKIVFCAGYFALMEFVNWTLAVSMYFVSWSFFWFQKSLGQVIAIVVTCFCKNRLASTWENWMNRIGCYVESLRTSLEMFIWSIELVSKYVIHTYTYGMKGGS